MIGVGRLARVASPRGCTRARIAARDGRGREARVARFSDGAYLTGPEHPRHAMPRCIVKGAERGLVRPGPSCAGEGSRLSIDADRGFIARFLSSKAAQPFGAVPSNDLSD
jgi:hypothetical protein